MPKSRGGCSLLIWIFGLSSSVLSALIGNDSPRVSGNLKWRCWQGLILEPNTDSPLSGNGAFPEGIQSLIGEEQSS